MKNARKVFTLLLVVVMVFSLIGCRNDQSDAQPQAGEWIAEDMFVNEWLGIQFQLPAGWHVPTPSELEEILGVGAMVLSYADALSEDVINAMEEMPAHDLYAMHVATGSVAQIMFQRVGRNTNMTQAIVEFSEGLRAAGLENIRTSEYTVFIGDVEFHVVYGGLSLMGTNVYFASYLNLEGRNFRVITINTMVEAEIAHILRYFNAIGTERIESIAPEMPEVDLGLTEADFLGIWDWDFGMDYAYEFFDDGTGIRGFPGMLEEFTWTLVNGELHLRIGVVVELWIPAIENNVLTITSLQAEGMIFNYIKRD